MEENLKQLLLKDLCARVPYHPKGHIVNACNGAECDEWLTCATFPMFTSITNNSRLYLRPMSSMTEEEDEKRIQLGIWRSAQTDEWEVVGITSDYRSSQGFQNALKFLLENHFDIFGLIPKGLAIEVTKENNPYNLKEE